MDIVKCLVSSGADINLRNKEGRSPLFVASQRGHCAIVKCLLSSGADINLRKKQGRSPLFEASYFGRYDVVKCLLSSGADINLRDEGGQSPLFVAKFAGYYDVVRLLEAHGAFRKEIVEDSNALLNTCGYPEEEIRHSIEKREEEKKPFTYQKYKKGRKK
jgi:ankyrin repeat protein